MKKILLLIFTCINLLCYSQWNNGNIAFNQPRANIAFVDSNTFLVAVGQSWSTGNKHVSIVQLAHLYNISANQSSILAMNTPRLEPIMVKETVAFIS